MREIGGYIEFEHYHGEMLHEDGIKLNCGRSCLAYLIELKQIQKIAMPLFMCDSVFEVCRAYNVQMRFYSVRETLRPELPEPEEDEWLYIMSYYGQTRTEDLEKYTAKYKRVIIDFSQDYFHEPVPGACCLYTCRKYFGVSDGGILYLDRPSEKILDLEQDYSYNHMNYLLGRFEKGAQEFYAESAENNKRFKGEGIKYMSKLTENILHSLDYDRIRKQRTENWECLHKELHMTNLLSVRSTPGAFSYPYLIPDAEDLRQYLIAEKVFVPVLWPNVRNDLDNTSAEYYLAEHIVPIPCDQRYTQDDMKHILDLITAFQKKQAEVKG